MSFAFSFVSLTDEAGLDQFSHLFPHLWPPEVLTNCLFSSGVSWVEQSVVAPLDDAVLHCLRNVNLVPKGEKLMGLSAPMKCGGLEATRFQSQQTFQM